jgi:hypothetical protein
LIGGAQPCDVFWQIGSSADLFTDTTFVGNILALTSINLQNGASVSGRALARNGAVTMDTNTVSNSNCAAGTTPTATPAAAGPTPTPPVLGAPNTGGAPVPGGGFPWFLVLVASVVGGLALGLSVRGYQGRA